MDEAKLRELYWSANRAIAAILESGERTLDDIIDELREDLS